LLAIELNIMISQRKKILFIVNPKSGTQNKICLEEVIAERINHNRISFVIQNTKYRKHAIALAKEAVLNKFDAVIAVGGDGTINEVSQGIFGSNTALGIIPNGSGNGLAHYLKIPMNVRDAMDVINSFCIIPIDSAVLNNNIFVSVAGLGFDAMVAHNFSKSKERGFLSYFRIIFRKYFKYKPKNYRLIFNGKEIQRKAMMITCANSNQYGFNTVISPTAKINDGLIDVCIIEKIPVVETPLLSILLFLKKIDSSKHIEIIKTSEITIIQTKKRPAHVDGDPIVSGKKINIRVNKKSLNVIVPKKTAEQIYPDFNKTVV
jgi:diacylglycerol kinase (ATP)